MTDDQRPDESFVERLKSIVGEAYVITEAERLADYSHDEYALEDLTQIPAVVVLPGNSEEVSGVLHLCSEAKVSVTPRGGGTGLCGGCVASPGGVIIGLERLNEVMEVDTDNMLARVSAGVRLEDFYRAVESAGLFFPPHPGDESAMIGGVIATNAGGARAVKFGVIRNFVRGLEVVLPDGRIIHPGGKTMKDSSGYSLLHLFIGSEGTLGIITEAVLNLMPPQQVMMTLVAPFETLKEAMRVVPLMIQEKILPLAVEFVSLKTIRESARFLGMDWPFQYGNAQLIFIVDGTSLEAVSCLGEKIHRLCTQNGAKDVFAAESAKDQKSLLKIRSNIYEALKPYTLEILDITVPRAAIADFVDDVESVAKKKGTWIPVYGHAADGNVHTHIMRCSCEAGEWKEFSGWQDSYHSIRDTLHELGKIYSGVPSGEHGIGLAKKRYLLDFLEADQLELMRGIKAVFDPAHILNPGKIFD